jgi:hypothetical protein
VFFNRLWTVYRSHLAHHVADMMEPYLVCEAVAGCRSENRNGVGVRVEQATD